jgi:hypothetical protein
MDRTTASPPILSRRVEINPGSLAFPRPDLLYPLGGVVVIVAILVYLSLSHQSSAALLAWLNPLACLLLFVVADLLGEPAGRNQQAGFHHLGMMSAVMIGGPLLGLGVALLGVGISAVIQLLLGRYSPIIVPTWREIARHALMRLGACLPALLLAWLVYTLAGGSLPFDSAIPQHLLAGLLAVVAGFAVARGVSWLLVRLTGELPLESINQAASNRALLTEFTLLALPLALATATTSDQPGLFLVLIAVLTVNAVRRWRYSHVQARRQLLEEQNETLLHKLSLVNLSIQNAMFNVDQSEAIKTACETAMAVTKANKAAVFLIDREKETLHLVESIGLNEDHRRLERDVSYHPDPLLSINPRMEMDTERNVVTPALREFAKKAKFRAFAEVPLRSGNVMMGYLSVFHNQPHIFNETELNLLDILVNQLTAALDNSPAAYPGNPRFRDDASGASLQHRQFQPGYGNRSAGYWRCPPADDRHGLCRHWLDARRD